LVRLPRLRREARDDVAEVVLIESGVRVDLPREESLAQGAERHEADPELFARRQNLLNTNYGTVFESQYDYVAANGGTWLNPTTILGPRFARVNLTFSY